MRTELRITSAHWNVLRSHLLLDDDEHAAMLICGSHSSDRSTLMLVREVVLLGIDDLEESSTSYNLRIKPSVIARLSKRASREAATLVLCHSHPFSGEVAPSALDMETESDLCGRVLVQRLSPRPVGALILGYDGMSGRIWTRNGMERLDRMRVIGPEIETFPSPDDSPDQADAVDRQIRAWGALGQAQLAGSRVSVVGTGGTGSHVVQQLAHLRVGRLVVIDPDTVETSNLSRIVGARVSDIGSPKAEVLARVASQINPDAEVIGISESVLDIDPQQLIESDIVICCTDSHGSRSLLTELAFQYMVPIVDLGVEIQPTQKPLRAGGGVRLVRPGGWCLHCAETLDYFLVREEYLSDAERKIEAKRGYLRGVSEPDPSVISLNGVVASLAVLELCHLLTGFLGGGKERLLYRAEARGLSAAAVKRNPACYVCGEEGLLGTGDGRSLPLRERYPCIA